MIKVNNKTVPIKRFPDGTVNVKGNPTLNHGTVLISWYYENDAEFMAVAFLTKYYQAHGNQVDLYMPYVPNARMDRVESAEDVFSMKYFGDMINSLNFQTVYVTDVHSSVAIAVIKNVRIIQIDAIVNHVTNMITEATGEDVLLFFPDEGAMKRYSKETNRPFAFGMKKRDWQTGKILGLDVLGMTADEIKGKNFLIRDDICSKGGTFYYAAKKLKELGANKIFLYATHCEKNILSGEFGEDKKNLLDTGLIEFVYTTNSIGCVPTNHKMIGVIGIDVGFAHEENECGCGCCHGGECADEE